MDKLNPNLYQQFKKAMRTMYESGYQQGYQAAQDEPESRLAKIALNQAHVKETLAALDTEPDLSQLDDYELLRLLNQRGLARQTRYYADLAWVELERRHGTQGLFDLLGILGGK